MNAKHIALAGMLAAGALVAAAVTGCSEKTKDILLPNQQPEVRLTAAPFDPSRATPYFYAYRMNWIGNDSDGRIQYFLYAVDPPETPGTPIPWVRTTRNEQIVFFTADSSDVRNSQATKPHVFALCAVDDDGDTSAVVQRGFYSYTQCPTATIVNPPPNNFFAITVTPSLRVSWTGQDPDGQLTTKPVKYKYILLSSATRFTVDRALSSPPELREYYAYKWAENGLPGPWAGWDSTTSDSTTVQYTNLSPNQLYMFVVVAFDEAGAFSPVFDRTQNMLLVRPGFAGTLGPKITVFNEFFIKEFGGGYSVSPLAEARIEVPAGQPIAFNWIAEPPAGANIEGYRWMFGLAGTLDPFDETARTNQSDFVHWSDLSLNVTSVTTPPLEGGRDYHLYIEARDNNDLRSLAPVRMTAIQSTLDKPLLVVNDTRVTLERLGPTGCVSAQLGDWPNQAELDTFFFARPGVPWVTCAGTIGTTDPDGGLFSGYSPDVVYTRRLPSDKTVRLATLGQYRNVVWLVDAGAGTTTNNPSAPYSLRYMSNFGRVNTLGAYVRQRGRVWIAGGGGAAALSRDLGNQQSNDLYGFVYSNRLPTELQPGKFMYDVTHWRSELQVSNTGAAVVKRSTRAVQPDGRPWTWEMETFEGPLQAPDYTQLPPSLDAKTQGTDRLPPTRASNPIQFFRSRVTYNFEYLTQPNSILEDVERDPGIVVEKSTLDTLFRTEAILLGGQEIWEQGGRNPDGTEKPGSVRGAPVMTYYHGLEFPKFVFTGFDMWNYQKPQLVQLVDFVLQRIFLLQKSSTAHVSARSVRGAPPTWSPPAAGVKAASGRAAAATAPAAPTRPGSQD